MSDKKISDSKEKKSEEIPVESLKNSKTEKVTKKAIKIRHGKNLKSILLRGIQLFIGAAIASAGLELFLIPNKVIDGGVVGLSIMANYIFTYIPFGIFLVILNLPFLYIGYKHIGKNFAISTIVAVLMLSFCSDIAHNFQPVTNDSFLAAIFGGIIDGIGVGIIMRAGGSLDGTEIVAIIADKHSPFSVGEIVMFINLFILSGAGLLFGWDKAMYSLVAYFVIAKMIDVVTKGLDETYAIMIVSNNPRELTEVLNTAIRGVTLLHGEGGYTGDPKEIIYCVVNRLEVTRVKDLVLSFDKNAFVTINSVHDIVGGRFKNKGH